MPIVYHTNADSEYDLLLFLKTQMPIVYHTNADSKICFLASLVKKNDAILLFLGRI
jgi:hypothetical protein